MAERDNFFQFTERCYPEDRAVVDSWIAWFTGRGIACEVRPVSGGVAVFREGRPHEWSAMEKCRTPGCTCGKWVGPPNAPRFRKALRERSPLDKILA